MLLSEVLDQLWGDVVSNDDCTCYVDQVHRVGVSYIDARRGLQRHREWLANQFQRPVPENAGCSRHVVVAYIGSNHIDMFLSIIASTSNPVGKSVDLRPALINTRWTALEIATVLQCADLVDCETLFLYGPSFRDLAQQAAGQLNHHARCLPIPILAPSSKLTTMDTKQKPNFNFEKFLSSGTNASDDDALIVFTSGTTSGSKGVRLSHRSILVQSLAKLGSPCFYDFQTRMLISTVPFFHVGGMTSILAVWLAGGTLIVPDDNNISPGFSAEVVERAIFKTSEKNQIVSVNTLVVVPAMLFALEQVVPNNKIYLHIRMILIGGQSASKSTLRFITKVFPKARVVQTYACTEASSSMTFLEINCSKIASDPTHGENLATGDCVGKPPPHIEICLFDASEAKPQTAVRVQSISQAFVPGIIATRGPHVMNGYWQRGQKQLQQISSQEWLRTNDLGYWDEQGQLYFFGRATDSIRTGGETVIASEVERVLLLHENITDCAVFGLPDIKFGEAVCCALVCRGTEPSVAELRQHCQRHGLAGYKRPRRVFSLPALPRNSSGKVLKFRLVEQFKKHIEVPLSRL